MNALGIVTPDQRGFDRQEVCVVDKKKHEFKFIGSMRKVSGHTLFSFNVVTKELKRAKVKKDSTYNIFTKQMVGRDKVVVEKNCVYLWSLNEKNALKRLKREGFIE